MVSEKTGAVALVRFFVRLDFADITKFLLPSCALIVSDQS
jgi:hypothetical protein